MEVNKEVFNEKNRWKLGTWNVKRYIGRRKEIRKESEEIGFGNICCNINKEAENEDHKDQKHRSKI